MPSAKSQRKQARKAALRMRERRAKRLTRNALICASVAGVVLVAMLVLTASGADDAAPWLVGPIGVAVLLAVAFLVRKEQVSPRTLNSLGRVGLVLASLAGLELVTSHIIYLMASRDTAHLVGMITIVPAVLAVVSLGSGWLGGPGRDDSTTTMMSDITRMHTS